MSQSLDHEAWPSINFEGEMLPQSMSGIHILINRDFTERTGDWIWRLPHCKQTRKGGEATWCIDSATEIIDHLLENRGEVVVEIQERLGSHGFDGQATIDEWLSGLARIKCLAEAREGECLWIAGEPTKNSEEKRQRFIDFLDKQQPPDA